MPWGSQPLHPSQAICLFFHVFANLASSVSPADVLAWGVSQRCSNFPAVMPFMPRSAKPVCSKDAGRAWSRQHQLQGRVCRRSRDHIKSGSYVWVPKPESMGHPEAVVRRISWQARCCKKLSPPMDSKGGDCGGLG